MVLNMCRVRWILIIKYLRRHWNLSVPGWEQSVEDESFDLVYTGYIEPNTDPLDLKAEFGREHEADDICGKRGKGGWAKTKLAKLGQKAQED